MTYGKLGSPGSGPSSPHRADQATTSHTPAPSAGKGKSSTSTDSGEIAYSDRHQSWDEMTAESKMETKRDQTPKPYLTTPFKMVVAPSRSASPISVPIRGRSPAPHRRSDAEIDLKGKKRQLDDGEKSFHTERSTKAAKPENEPSTVKREYSIEKGKVLTSGTYAATSAAMDPGNRAKHEARKKPGEMLTDKELNDIVTQPASLEHPQYITEHRHFSIREYATKDSYTPTRTTVVSSPKLSASLKTIIAKTKQKYVDYIQTGDVGDTYVGGGKTASVNVLSPDSGPDSSGNRPREAKTTFHVRPRPKETEQQASDREFYKRVKRDTDGKQPKQDKDKNKP